MAGSAGDIYFCIKSELRAMEMDLIESFAFLVVVSCLLYSSVSLLAHWNKKKSLKGQYVVLENKFKIRIQDTEENEVPRTVFETRKVAGSAKHKHGKTVRNCVGL